MTILEVINGVIDKLAAAVKKEEFKALEPAYKQMVETKSLKMLGNMRFQYTVSERWDLVSQDRFEQLLRDRCL